MKRIKQTVCLLLSVMLISISTVAGFAAETAKIYGNIDGDNDISVKDATLILKSLVQLATIDDENKALADVDGDNELSVSDATCILKYLVGLSGSGKTGEPYLTEEEKIAALKQEVLDLVNVERAAEGLNPLEFDADVSACADVRAQEIVDVFDHKRLDGTHWYTIFDEMNVPIISTAGENIAAGYPTPSSVMDGWMNSEGHRINILRPEFSRLGVGIYVDNGRYYWVQLFMG